MSAILARLEGDRQAPTRCVQAMSADTDSQPPPYCWPTLRRFQVCPKQVAVPKGFEVVRELAAQIMCRAWQEWVVKCPERMEVALSKVKVLVCTASLASRLLAAPSPHPSRNCGRMPEPING